METSKRQQPEIEARMIARFSDLPEIQADINKYKQTQDGLREMADSVKKHIDSLKGELKALADKAVENRNALWKKIDEQLLAKDLATKHELENGHFEINFTHGQILVTGECDHSPDLPAPLMEMLDKLKAKGIKVDVETSSH